MYKYLESREMKQLGLYRLVCCDRLAWKRSSSAELVAVVNRVETRGIDPGRAEERR